MKTMENETIEARVRRFLKFAGVGQLLLKESVGSARALEILRAIDVSSLLRCPSARRYSCLREIRYDFGTLIANPANYLEGINDREFSGTYQQLRHNDEITHKLVLENNLFFNLPQQILFMARLQYLAAEGLSEHMKRLPARYHIRWQTTYETQNRYCAIETSQN